MLLVIVSFFLNLFNIVEFYKIGFYFIRWIGIKVDWKVGWIRNVGICCGVRLCVE